MYVILYFYVSLVVFGLIALTFVLLPEIRNFFIKFFTESELKFPKLRCKDFIKYYRVNPDRWILGDNIVSYSCESLITFSIPFNDKFKYYIFKRKANSIKEKEKYDEVYKILIDNVQEDINKLRQEYYNRLDMK